MISSLFLWLSIKFRVCVHVGLAVFRTYRHSYFSLEIALPEIADKR